MINPLFYGKLVINIVSHKRNVSVAQRSFGPVCTEGDVSIKNQNGTIEKDECWLLLTALKSPASETDVVSNLLNSISIYFCLKETI